jgi:RNA polymerase sigma-70 factor (ECF subfamily)
VPKQTAVDSSDDQEKLFQRLFDEHYLDIYRYCVRRVGVTDAEDTTADVFAVAWRRLEELPEGEATRPWLYGVAFRVVANRYRTRLRHLRLVARVGSMTPRDSEDAAPSSPEFEADHEIELLHAALDSLSSNDRELIRLSSWDGLSRGEIAQVLGINENAVDQRLYRARTRLKSRMALLDGSKIQEAGTAI